MQYLILYEKKAFYTNWFDAENNYTNGMIIFDLINHTYSTNGKEWNEIKEDQL